MGTPPPVRREDALSNMKVGEPASEVRFNTSASARFLDLRTYTEEYILNNVDLHLGANLHFPMKSILNRAQTEL